MEAEPGIFSRIFEFGWALLPYWWLLVPGGVFALEPMAEALLPTSLKERLDRAWPKHRRHTHFRMASVAALMVAGFLAFDDVNLRNRGLAASVKQISGERDEARRQRDRNVSPAIDRLSGDLTYARGQIDAQKDQIEAQEKKIDEQSLKIARLALPKPARHLTQDQKDALVRNLTPIATDLGEIVVTSPIGDGNAYGYSDEFLDLFKGVTGLKSGRGAGVLSTSPMGPGPDVEIVVKKLDAANTKAELFAKALVASGIKVRGGTMSTLGDDAFMLVIGPAQ